MQYNQTAVLMQQRIRGDKLKKEYAFCVKDLNSISDSSSIYIYGAGYFAREICDYLIMNSINVTGIAVSSCEGNPDEINGVAVKTYKEWVDSGVDCNPDRVLVIGINCGDKIFGNTFDEDGWGEIIFSTPELIKDILINKLKYPYTECDTVRKIETNYSGLEAGFVMVSEDSGVPLARLLLVDVCRELVGEIKYCTRNEISKLYGDLVYKSIDRDEGFYDSKAAVYVVTSVNNKTDIYQKLPGGYELVQGGTALTKEKLQCLHDDSGDNISAKNSIYSECSVHYWVWKNIHDKEYVGISHYRRQQRFGDKTVEWVKKNNMDIIASMPQFTLQKLDIFYSKYIEVEYWEIMREALGQMDEKYVDKFDAVRNGHFYFPCNILFAEKNAFDRYCAFLFDVTNRIEKIVAARKIEAPKRYMGYLTEIIESVYFAINRNNIRIAYSDVQYYTK